MKRRVLILLVVGLASVAGAQSVDSTGDSVGQVDSGAEAALGAGDSWGQREPLGEEALGFSQAEAGDSEAAGQTFGLFDLLRAVLVIAGVVGAIYVLMYFLRKSTIAGGRDADLVEILSSTVIAGNRSVHLLKVGEQLFLVGAADHGVTLLSAIDDPETRDQVALRASQLDRPANRKSFGEMLASVVGRGSTPSVDGSQVSTDFLVQQRERLQRSTGG